MERKMEKTTDNHLLKFCIEVILQVLKLTDNKIKQLRGDDGLAQSAGGVRAAESRDISGWWSQ